MPIKINDDSSGQRLDIAVSQWLKQSRSQAQKLIKGGLVAVNRQPVIKTNYQLKSGDSLAVKAAARSSAKRQSALPPVAVIKDTADYLVINKPAGVLVHATGASRELTLVDWLVKHYPKIKNTGDDPKRAGLVHRLDRDVSGLMVVAKTPAAFADLKRQFQNRTVIKQYQALVYGALKQESGVINFLLARSASGKMAARPLNQSGREAITEFQVIKSFINYTYLRLAIKTGRTHQIRAHLAALGHPLLGDNLYGTPVTKAKNKKFNLGRIWLVATRLAFTDSVGQRQEFAIDLPPELKDVLGKVK